MIKFLFCSFQKMENIKMKAMIKNKNIQILIFTDYKKDKSNKIVLCETFWQPWTLMLTNGVEAFKVILAMPIVLTHLICSS